MCQRCQRTELDHIWSDGWDGTTYDGLCERCFHESSSTPMPGPSASPAAAPEPKQPTLGTEYSATSPCSAEEVRRLPDDRSKARKASAAADHARAQSLSALLGSLTDRQLAVDNLIEKLTEGVMHGLATERDKLLWEKPSKKKGASR